DDPRSFGSPRRRMEPRQRLGTDEIRARSHEGKLREVRLGHGTIAATQLTGDPVQRERCRFARGPTPCRQRIVDLEGSAIDARGDELRDRTCGDIAFGSTPKEPAFGANAFAPLRRAPL